MPPVWGWMLLLAAFILTGVIMTWRTFAKVRRLLEARPPTTDLWQAHAPSADSQTIDTFLKAYCTSFTVAERLAWRLRPDDPLNLVYALHYPKRASSLSSSEHSHFLKALERLSGTPLTEDETLQGTLGEILDHVLRASTTTKNLAEKDSTELDRQPSPEAKRLP